MVIYWKAIALGRLEELRKRAGKIEKEADILSAIKLIGMPDDLKKDLLAMPISLGVMVGPAPMAWAINTTEETINKMIEKVRGYKEV